MIKLCLALCCLTATTSATFNLDPADLLFSPAKRVKVDTVQYLVETLNGYPYEEHVITTPDDYKLELHRIPHDGSETSAKASANGQRPVVLLGHGMEASSAQWAFGPGNRSLAYYFV